jgi:NAD(P)-dependent dehydrogenase (short-subunit alcohol dehydrogenase family)
VSDGKVLVLGGDGFYGRYLVTDILTHTNANVLIASRHPRQEMALNPRVETAVCDINDFAQLVELAQPCDIIAHCAGPFQFLPLNPLRAAIQTQTHYVDISEDRRFAQQVRKMATEIDDAGIMACSGFSVAPAMEALFAQMLKPTFAEMWSLRSFAAPDTRKHRGKAMFYTMLLGVGRPFSQPRQGQKVQVAGWTEPEWVDFPAPVGRRLTYLVLEMADLDYLPELFGLKTVEFKAGTEHPSLNRLLGLLAAMRLKLGRPDWERFALFVRATSWLAGRVGKDEGGVFFEAGGMVGPTFQLRRVALMAEQDGGLIPSVLAGIGIEQMLNGRLSTPGLLPMHTWISLEELEASLQRRGLKLLWQPEGQPPWQTFTLADLRPYLIDKPVA